MTDVWHVPLLVDTILSFLNVWDMSMSLSVLVPPEEQKVYESRVKRAAERDFVLQRVLPRVPCSEGIEGFITPDMERIVALACRSCATVHDMMLGYTLVFDFITAAGRNGTERLHRIYHLAHEVVDHMPRSLPSRQVRVVFHHALRYGPRSCTCPERTLSRYS